MILLDTAPLVALCDPRDGLHRTALHDLDGLGGQPFMTCNAVLTEASALLTRSIQRRRLRRFLDDFSVAAYRIEDETAMWAEVFAWLEKYDEHEPDWADASLAVISGRERECRVWTYDREFRTVWRRPDGTRIPLANQGR